MLVKTVKIHLIWAAAHPGQDRRLPSVVTHSRLQRATSVRSRVGIVLEEGSGVAIDWVTGRSYSSARRRLNVQSGQRKGRKGAAAPFPSVAVRDRGHWKGDAGSLWPRKLDVWDGEEPEGHQRFYGQWTNLLDQSQNRPKLVTNDYLVWSLTSITHVNTNNIVMWETLQNNADWDCFKTPTLQEILRTRKLLQVEHCVFSEATRSFQSVGYSSTESEIISLDAGLRLDGIPALDLWDLIVAVLHGNTYQSNQERGDPCTNLAKEISWNDWWSRQCWFYFLERAFFSSGSFVLYLKTTKQWSRWS